MSGRCQPRISLLTGLFGTELLRVLKVLRGQFEVRVRTSVRANIVHLDCRPQFMLGAPCSGINLNGRYVLP